MIANAEMLPEFVFVTYANPPFGEIATPTGPMPTAKGEPDTAVSAPVAGLIV